MRVLLTGASGFLGRAWSLAAGPDVEIAAVGRSAPAETAETAGRLALVEADLSVPGALAEAIASGALPDTIDAVLHLAVSRDHRRFPDRALDMFEVNAAATAHLLDYARRAGAKQFVLGSTGTVYGGRCGGGLLDEDRPVAPDAYFAVTKRAAELLAEAYGAHFAVAILRFFVPYGPGQSDRLIPDLISRVRAGEAVTLPPESDGMKFTASYKDDVVRVLSACLSRRWSGVFNVSTDEPLSLREAARIIGEAVGREPRFEVAPSASSLELVPSLARLGERMATADFTRFREGVKLTLAS